MPITFIPDAPVAGNGINFIPDEQQGFGSLKEPNIPSGGATIGARTPGLNERLVGLLQSNPVTKNIPKNLTSGVQALEGLMGTPSMVQNLPDSGSKALLEQVNLPNIGLAAIAGPYIAAAKTSVLGRAILAGVLAKFGVSGAEEAGTEFGTVAGTPKPVEVPRTKPEEQSLGDMINGLGDPQKLVNGMTKVTSGLLIDPSAPESSPEQKELDYHKVRGIIAALSALPAVGAKHIGESLGRVEGSGIPSSAIRGSLQDIQFTPDVLKHEGDAQRVASEVPVAAPSSVVEAGRPESGMFSGVPISKEWLAKVRPVFIGKQEDFSGKTEGFNMYNLKGAILDDNGKVLHSEGSTVSEGTLKKYGIPVPGVAEAKAEGGSKSGTQTKLNSGVSVPDWQEIKDKVGLGEGDWTHQGVKIAMLEHGFKSTDTQVDAGQLKNRVINKLNSESSEAKMWKSLGIDERFKQGEKASPEEMAKWMTENGPRVEVRKFENAQQTPEAVKYSELRHWVDSQPPDIKQDFRAITTGRLNPNADYFSVLEGQYGKETRNNFERLLELHQQLKNTPVEQIPASHWQSIAPKSEKDMPGYVEIAVVKPLKRNDLDDPEHAQRLGWDVGHQFPSSHSYPPNTIAFLRGYIEPLPTGKKVFHVIEVQSDWAQQHRENMKESEGMTPEQIRHEWKGGRIQGDVLLPHYERLALKAVIDHARKEGADEIAVSDAETAMMTEGHDRAISSQGPYRDIVNAEYVLDNHDDENNYHIVREGNNYYVRSKQPSQSEGMRLHYDRTLPKIAEELTGEEGRKVDFGEHKMAMQDVGGDYNEPRKDLIFRNEAGQPKTTITARSFPLTKLSNRIATGEPLTQMGKLYSGIELPKQVQDAVAEAGKFLGLGKFTSSDKLPKKPVAINPKAPTNLESTLDKVTNTTPIESREVGRNQPGEKETTLQGLSKFVNEKINLAAKADKLLLPVDAIFDRMDGSKGEYNGWLFQNIRKPIDEQFNYELQLRDSMLNPVTKLAKDLKLADTQSAERIGVFAQAQQKGGRERMIKSGILSETIDKITRTITPKEKQVYQTMRVMMDQSLPAVQSVMKELYGKEVKPVENYFPMPRDYDVYKDEPTAEIQGKFDDRMLWRLLEGDYEPKGNKSEQGFTIERKPKSKTAIKINAYEIYQQHVRDVAHLLAMQKTLNEIGQTVRRPMFAEKYGDVGQELTLDWLNTIARQGKSGKQIRFLDILRNNTSKAIIGFRIASQLVHTANVPLAIGRAGLVNWHKGLGEAMLSDKGEKFLHDHFEETFERGGGEPSLVEASRNPKGGWVFGVQRLIDRANAQATVLGVYMSELEKKGLNPDAYATLPFDRDAGAKAMVLARRAVASPLYKDIPPALARGGSLGKLFFQFQNTFLDQWSNIRHDLVTAGIKQMQPGYAARMAIALASMMLLEVGIKQGTKNAVLAATGNETEGKDAFIHHLETDALRRVPGMGQLMSAVLYGETGLPTADVAIDAIRGGVEASTGKRIQGYPNAKPNELTRIQGGVKAAASIAELMGVPGTSQSAEIIQDLLKKNKKKNKGKVTYAP